MKTIDKIMRCERKYAECFCIASEQQDFTRFRDALIPDMYYHNYTWVKNAKDDLALIRLIEDEINCSKRTGRDFCLVRCPMPVSKSILAQLSHTPEVAMSGYYLFDISDLPKLNSTAQCSIHKVDKPEMVEDILRLDLEHDEDSLGGDFCTRRVYRRKDVYLSNEGVDSYVCYDSDGAVGSCDMFIFGDTAKIEDFAILPRKQRKGYGTAILKILIDIAIKRNATTIYLETDTDGGAQQMYLKCGFSKVFEFTDLIFTDLTSSPGSRS